MKKLLRNVALVVVSIVGILLLKIGFIFLLVGLMPTVMAYMIDDDPKKNLYKCVRTCNLAGMLPTLFSLVNRSYPAASLQVVMSDPLIWLIVYGSAFGGWVLIWGCRSVAGLFIMGSNQARILILEQEKKALIEEWGEDVAR